MADNRRTLSIRNSADEAELFLYGEVGSWQVNVDSLRYQLAQLKGKDLTIRIHSPGGSVFDGMAIFNLIRSYKGNTTSITDGLAASMGSIAALAAKKVKMRKNSLMMIHNPWGMFQGDAEELRNYAELLDTVGGQLRAIYMEKTGLDEKKLRQMMDRESWFSAQQALALGFSDETVDEPAMAMAGSLLSDVGGYMFSKFKPLPGYEAPAAPAEESPQQSSTTLQNDSTAMQHTIQALGLTGNPTDPEVAAKARELKAENDQLKAQVAALAEAAQKQVKAEADSLVNAAIADGRINADQKEAWMGLLSNNLESGKVALGGLPKAKSLTQVPAGKTGAAAKPAGEDRANWTFADYRKKDPAALAEMKDNDTEAYERLLATRA